MHWNIFAANPSWGSVSYVPETVRTRAEAKRLALKTGRRVRFTKGAGGFVQPPNVQRSASNPRKRTRIEQLRDELPPGYTVSTYSPGDGVTRYRFFHNAPSNQTYFGPANGIYTALGYKEAYTFARGLQRDG